MHPTDSREPFKYNYVVDKDGDSHVYMTQDEYVAAISKAAGRDSMSWKDVETARKAASTTWDAAELVEKARKAAKEYQRDAEAARMDQLTLLSLTHTLHSLLTKKFDTTEDADDTLDTWLIPDEREMLNKLLELHSDYSKRSGA